MSAPPLVLRAMGSTATLPLEREGDSG